LWTNGPKEGIEFFDYSYDEHFGRQLPVYMPRQALLEYMLARVVKHCPNFFEKYVQFCTSVTKVIYQNDTSKFQVTTHNTVTGIVTSTLFDKCIWAAGDNGEPYMPHSMLQNLEGFRGKILHSSNTATFADDVRGKRVLLVGGSYSAEDLALMACKVGVERVFVASRSDENVVTWMGQWPDDKVECMVNCTPAKVEKGSTIILNRTQWVEHLKYEVVESEKPLVLTDIDTIILCTGYRGQFGMLEPKLREWSSEHDYYNRTFTVPDDWEMAPNAMTKTLGHIPNPKEARWFGSLVGCPDLYRGVMIDNPSMMFLRHEHEDYPILAIDGVAWLLMQFLTGGRELPSKEEMRKQNLEQALHEMKHYPYCRSIMDRSYMAEWNEDTDPGWKIYTKDYEKRNKYDFMLMARTMREANHPFNMGTIDGLNQIGKTLCRYGYLSYEHRVDASKTTTFRDVNDSHKFKSIFTGTTAIPLKKLWMEIDENEDRCIV
jgi:cation diffusion facilitator CzcD-associated flavoprotein CzcO